MTDQVTPEGGALPSDANASPTPVTTDVVAPAKGSEADSSPAADPSETTKPKGEGRRIDELTRRWREEQRRSDRLMQQNEELMRRIAPVPQEKPQQQPVAKTFKDFNFDENAYRQHVYDELRTEAAKTADARIASWKEEQEAIGRRAKFDERASRFAATTDDYNDVVQGTWECSKAMAEVIEDSEEGPALAYYLAQNPEEAAKLARMSGPRAGREIARIEDRILSERKKAAQKPVTQAPPPPPTLEGENPGNVEKDPAKMSDAEFAKWRKRQIAQRR